MQKPNPKVKGERQKFIVETRPKELTNIRNIRRLNREKRYCALSHITIGFIIT